MEIELWMWNGDWGLPTVEFNCLSVLSLLKFSGERVQLGLRYTNNPFSTPDGHLPSVKCSKKHIRRFEDIRKFLINENCSPDLNLNEKQLAESLAYRIMVEEKLYPALRYTWWIDSKNYEGLTRPCVVKSLQFPFNFYYPSHYKRESEEAIDSLYQNMETADVEIKVYREAQRCLTCLSRRLGENDFFYGSSPSSLDAVVYGCLAPLIEAPFPSKVLQNHTKTSTNLVEFVRRITKKYFPHEMEEYEKKRREEIDTNHPEKADEFLPHKRRNQVLAVVFALAASFTYAVGNGLFSVSLGDIKDFQKDEEYENNKLV